MGFKLDIWNYITFASIFVLVAAGVAALPSVVPFLVAARALIRWALAKRLFRCLSFTRPL
jgi:hypothetical protein